jgi:hypothetical protein
MESAILFPGRPTTTKLEFTTPKFDAILTEIIEQALIRSGISFEKKNEVQQYQTLVVGSKRHPGIDAILAYVGRHAEKPLQKGATCLETQLWVPDYIRFPATVPVEKKEAMLNHLIGNCKDCFRDLYTDGILYAMAIKRNSIRN